MVNRKFIKTSSLPENKKSLTGFNRFHLFEFEDQSWFPEVIRSGGMDYLRFLFMQTKMYQPIVKLIKETLEEAGENKIVDLCSGGGGYIEQIAQELNKSDKNKYSFLLTDKFPNIATYEYIKENSEATIGFCPTPLDVLDVPEDLKGMRVLFSAIHHFRPQQVQQILQQAVNAKAPIGIFDGGEKNIWIMLGILILHPLGMLLVTPFLKPFKFSRLFFTYIIPLIPLYTIWDGLVSILRLYSPQDLYKIADSITNHNYKWKYGKVKNSLGIKVAYLIGIPGEGQLRIKN